jgi:hypothetical protein
VGLNDILQLAGMVGEAVIIGLLLYRRSWHTLPFFCVYTGWCLLSDCGDYFVSHYFAAHYFTVYFVGQIVDFSLQFCVLVELAWSVFRPFRASLPRHAIWFFVVLIAGIGAAIWPFADSPVFNRFPFQWHLLVHMQQTDAVLRIVFFLLLASCSHLLSIGWRDRELQVATGLGFYSLAAFTVTLMHAHLDAGSRYRRLDQFLVATYVCSLVYWSVSFAQKEAERREFSPQMQGLLLAVAGAARTTRIALSDPGPGKSGKGRRP